MSTKEGAQLVCTTDINAPIIPIRGDKFTIGRAQSCDLSLPSNKLISGQHCELTRHDDGTMLLKDTSTNGTLINSSQRVTKGKEHKLQHGDEIFLVFKKDDTSKNVAYMFQDLSQLLDETLLNEEQGSEEECTQEYEFQKGESDTRPTDAVMKRPAAPVDSGDAVPAKRHCDEQSLLVKPDVSGDAVPAKRHCDEQSLLVKPDALCQPSKHIRDSDTTSVALTDVVCDTGCTDIQPEADPPTVSTSVAVCNKTLPADVVSGVNIPTGIGIAAGIRTVTSEAADSVLNTSPGIGIATGIGTVTSEASDSVSGVNATPGIGIATGINTATTPTSIGAVAAVDSPVEVPSASGHDDESESVPSHEGMAGTLVCSICQDIFHDCVSLQPCLHSFCAACYSSWMDISKECPSCRNNVERISRNFIVNSLVEAFVKEHPDKKRSEEETAEMDAKNKITRDMMTLAKKKQSYVIEIGSSGDDDMSGDDSDNDHDDNFVFAFRDHIVNTFGNRQPQRPPDPVCRQCPGYNGALSGVASNIMPGTSTWDNSQVGTSTAASAPSTSQLGSSSGLPMNPNQPTSSSAAASTSSADGSASRGHRFKGLMGDYILMPNAPPFVCLPGANHLMCTCCRCHMPDRRQEYHANHRAVPSQKCDICGNFFCHLYWGCEKFDCYGCLNKFGDLFFGQKCLDNLILKNGYESDILKSHLQRNKLTWKDVLQTCMTKLDSGEYSCEAGANHRITSANTVCYHCGLKNFQELAYQYRKDIPRDQLPMHVVARPDCHWGNKCRTQACKINHATNFNHICDQTRF